MEQKDFISDKTMREIDLISDEILNPCQIGGGNLCNADVDDMFVAVS